MLSRAPALFLLLAGLASAAPGLNPDSGLPVAAERLRTERWPARWITHPAAPRSDQGVYLFRKSFELPQPPARFVVHVTGDARYRLWVNGEPVCSGPQWSDTLVWRYESVDLAPWLRAGANVIAARVVGYGNPGPLASMSLRTGLLVQGDTAAESVADTNDSWKVVRDSHGVYDDQRARLRTYLVVSPGDSFDGNAHPWGWEQPGFDATAWSAPRLLDQGTPYGLGTDIGGWLKPRSIPLLEEKPVRFARVRRAEGVGVAPGFVAGGAPFTVPARSRATVLLDQDQLTNAFPRLTVSGGRGSRVTLSYAEGLVDAAGSKGPRDEVDGRVLRGIGDEFLPDGGAHRVYAPPDFRTYRYLELAVTTGDEPLVVEDLQGVFTGYPFRERGAFTSDDPELARVWEVGWRTARLCAIDTYIDCPYYEQLQYVGDTRIQALISLAVAGDDRLMRNAIELYDRSRIADGLTQSRYPSAAPQVINTFSLFWIDMVHDYWRHRDDPAFVGARLPGVRSVLEWFESRIDPATGLLGPLPYWTFVDWAVEWPWNNTLGVGGTPAGAREGGSSIVSLQLAGTLARAAELSRAFGRPDLATRYDRLAAGLRQAVVRHCWDGQRRLFADTPEKKTFSQHANTFAVLAGAIEGEPARELMERVVADPALIQATTYFRFYVLRALKHAGLGDRYLEMLGPWRTMLELGLTTFAERPEPTRSDCHAWSASPVYELLATVCGIEPGAPGFASVRIEPHLGHLRRAEGRVMHPAGEVAVALVRVGEGLRATVALPAGVPGTLVWRGQSHRLVPGSQTLTLP